MAMAMATAMALSIPAMPVYQNEKVEAAAVKEAEATSALDVEVWEDQEIAKVSLKDGAEADVIYYAVTTKDKDGKTKFPKAAAYEAMKYEKGKDGKASFDISWVNRKKEQVLCVATGSSIEEIKPVEVNLPAQDTLMATYSGTLDDKDIKENVVGDADNGYLTFNTGTKKAPVAVSAGAVQYRTVNGHWSNAENLDLSYYAAKGATLQMRVDAKDGVRPYGKIVNVKIKAKAKAPNVTINYNDKMVSEPKSVQYSLDGGENWTEATTKKETVEFGMLGWDGTAEKTVYFRTAGDSKKASSKIKYVTIKKEETSFAELTAPVSGAAVIADLPKVGDGKLDVRYKTAYKNDSGLVFTNTTDDMYQVAFAKKTDIENYTTTAGGKTTLKAVSSAAIVAKSAKKVTWANVTAQDKAKNKLGTGKLSLKKGEKLEDYVILYRICDKKGATVNSEVRVFDVPGVVEQSITVLDASTPVTTLELAKTATGSAVSKKELTVSGSGISANAKYTVGAYTDEGCKTKYTKLSVKLATGKLTVEAGTKTEKGTYYVKVVAEGAEKIIKVTVNE